jgi:uncharacterized lipoprotein YehR (DUF1307 family)
MVILKVAFTMKDSPPEQELKKLLNQLVDVYKNVPGLKQKYFLSDPKTGEAGGIYIFESQEALDKYLKSDVYKNVVLANATGQPKIEMFIIAATLDAGVLM